MVKRKCAKHCRRKVVKRAGKKKGGKKGDKSKTHPGGKDYNTRLGSKVFHRLGHDVRLKRRPFNK